MSETGIFASVHGVALGYLLRIAKAVSYNVEERFDIVCASSHFLYDVLTAYYFSRKSSCGFFAMYVHHLIPDLARRLYAGRLQSIISWVSQYLSLRIARRYCRLLFTLESQLVALSARGFGNRIFVTRNAAEIVYTSLSNREPAYSGCFVGRLVRTKGILDLPRIWAKVSSRLPGARLAIIGTGSQSNIEKITRSLESLNIRDNADLMLGASNRMKASVLRSSRVFLSPSYEEGWGLAISEALAVGIPVVAYDLPAYSKTFQSGIHRVPIGDVDQFTKVVVSLLSDNNRNPMPIGNPGTQDSMLHGWDEIAKDEISALIQAFRKWEL